jgi:hypothetical protein
VRRSLALIGTVGWLFMLPLPALARSETCASLEGLTPVSSYVARVLERAERGLAHAASAPAASSFDLERPQWVSTIASTVLASIDTRSQTSDVVLQLTEATACLRLDERLLDCALEDVRDAFNEGLQRGSPLQLQRLQDLYSWLMQRRTSLRLGALDPSYADPGWGQWQSFDPETNGSCCGLDDNGSLACLSVPARSCLPGDFFSDQEACEATCLAAPIDRQTQVCPYTSDYGPPTLDGTGCDASILASRSADEGVRREGEALGALLARIRQRQPATESGSVRLPRTVHVVVTGCAPTVGSCQQAPDRRCGTDADCSPGDRCRFTRGVCLLDRNVRCLSDRDCQRTVPPESSSASSQRSSEDLLDPRAVCLQDDQPLPLHTARRGPFSVDVDHLRLLVRGTALGQRLAASRVATLPARGSGSTIGKSPIAVLLERSQSDILRSFAQDQGRRDSWIRPLNEGATLFRQQLLAPLREVIASLAQLVSSKDGVRALVPTFTDLLDRSCTNRACGPDLARLRSLAATDECFPYANGAYLEDVCETGNSRADQCIQKAGLSGIAVPACPDETSSSSAAN